MMPVSDIADPVYNRRIIVFDSGIGGFSILREIINQRLPVSVIYLADQANFPYGHKSAEWLESRLKEIALWGVAQDPAAFVVACNTGTVAGIRTMRETLHCPVVGVEPVIKPLSSYTHALVLATQAAAESIRTQELLDIHGRHIQVYASKGLASAIENNDSEQVKISLDEISEIIEHEHIQAIGLSCTHYPLISDKIKERFPAIHLYDPSSAVVHRLKKVLELDGPAEPEGRGIEFLTTGEVIRLDEQIRAYFDSSYHGSQVHI